jgi:hypothetical protein
MNNAPITRQHREWALRTLAPKDAEDMIAAGADDQVIAAFLDAGYVKPEDLGALDEVDRASYDLFVDIAQAFANFEFELRTATDAALAEARDHAKALDSNWDKFSRISLDTLRAALGVCADSSVHDMVRRIEQLREGEVIVESD